MKGSQKRRSRIQPEADPPWAEVDDNMYYIYVLYSDKLKKRYVGLTKDLRGRFSQHNQGGSDFTNRGKPWKLLYYEAFQSKADAIEEEKFLKSGKGRERLNICLKETIKEL